MKKSLIPVIVIFLSLSFLSLSAAPGQCATQAAAESGAACSNGEWKCSEDAYTLHVCKNKKWESVACMAGSGMLCYKGACVLPSSYGAPKWPDAAGEPLATPSSLAAKAKYFEDTAARLHVNPNLKWIMAVHLPCKKVQCAPSQKQPCEDCSDTAIPEEKATWKDVVKWDTGENDGLFNGLYMAAEAYRYAATKDPAALKMLRILMDGEVTRMEITGVPGVFTRQYIPPGVPGISCPGKLDAYIPSVTKEDNQWVKIGDDGCVWYVDGKTRQWTASKHCGLKKYANYCWLDNVSKDEYSGHMLALAAVAKLVDDPKIHEQAKELLLQVGRHLVKTGLRVTDWDGRVTEHGRLIPFSMDDYPGFNGAMSQSFMSVAAQVTRDPELVSFYENCMLHKSGFKSCPGIFKMNRKAFYDYLSYTGIYRGDEACLSNYNNISMHMLSMYDLVWYERDPALREIYQKSLDEDIFRAKDQPRSLMHQNNAFFDFIWASQKRLGPGSDGPAYDAVENAIAMLRQFPERKHPKEIKCTPETCTPYCLNRFYGPVTNHAHTIAERCTGEFVWWWDPYAYQNCRLNRRVIFYASDYLLAYWMGRYYGFIGPNL